MAANALPQDIVLLVCQELAHRRDFNSLFQCSLVSRRVAGIALQQLYSIQDNSAVGTGDSGDSHEWARLWKSIILSSTGRTLFPYCFYIRTLSFGNLEECLNDVTRDRYLRSYFFDVEQEMDQFLVLRENVKKSTRKTTSAPMPLVNQQATVVKCGEAITKYMQQLAAESSTTVPLSTLEMTHIPMTILPSWIMRLPSLRRLQVRDGSIITAEVGSAIYECCPNFSELGLLHCSSVTADEDMATFLQTIKPNSLRSFEVSSLNSLGERTFAALNSHAATLKTLCLGSLSSQAMRALNSFPACTALERVAIENDVHQKLESLNEGLFKELTTWLKSCHSLQHLSFEHVQDALLITSDVLSNPRIKLRSLVLKDFRSQPQDRSSPLWAALAWQNELESLYIGGQDGAMEGLVIHENPPLADSICCLKTLKELNLTQAFVRIHDIKQFVTSLPHLEEFGFGGDYVDDSILDSLRTLRHMKILKINAFSVFRWEALQDFANQLDPVTHRGIRVDVLNQLGDNKIGEEEQALLSTYFAEKLNGAIDIGYQFDPDELHEGDFSEDGSD